MIHPLFSKLLAFEDLAFAEAEQLMDIIMEGNATPVQVAGVLIALRMKKETIDEISGMASSMRNHGERINPHGDVVDTCGTGGDLSHSINVSTMSAIVAAACGVRIAKHGNRSVSSSCGSADLLEELGVNINLTPDQVEATINEVGIGFMFAPRFHASMKHAIVPRKELGVRTIFNILGPLTNPAQAKYQLLGVFQPELTEVMASVLKKLGTARALVVHGLDGLDEISIAGPTRVSELTLAGDIRTYDLNPQDYGIRLAPKDAIRGGDKQENARITLTILEGKEQGPLRDIIVINAAAVLMAVGKAASFATAIDQARSVLDNGSALSKLQQFITYTRQFG